MTTVLSQEPFKVFDADRLLPKSPTLYRAKGGPIPPWRRSRSGPQSELGISEKVRRTDRASRSKSVENRHLDIHEYQIEFQFCDRIHRFLTVFGQRHRRAQRSNIRDANSRFIGLSSATRTCGLRRAQNHAPSADPRESRQSMSASDCSVDNSGDCADSVSAATAPRTVNQNVEPIPSG